MLSVAKDELELFYLYFPASWMLGLQAYHYIGISGVKEWTQGLQHGRQTLYQMNYISRPIIKHVLNVWPGESVLEAANMVS